MQIEQPRHIQFAVLVFVPRVTAPVIEDDGTPRVEEVYPTAEGTWVYVGGSSNGQNAKGLLDAMLDHVQSVFYLRIVETDRHDKWGIESLCENQALPVNHLYGQG